MIVTGGDGAGLPNNNNVNWDSIYVAPTGGMTLSWAGWGLIMTAMAPLH